MIQQYVFRFFWINGAWTISSVGRIHESPVGDEVVILARDVKHARFLLRIQAWCSDPNEPVGILEWYMQMNEGLTLLFDGCVTTGRLEIPYRKRVSRSEVKRALWRHLVKHGTIQGSRTAQNW